MLRQSGIALAALLVLLTGGMTPQRSQANGDIGEHVHNLKAHLDEYTAEVEELITKVDGLVDRYREKGAEGVDTQKLIDWWEGVKVHAAVETNYVPAYAAIWQGIYGVKGAIEKGQPVAEVRKQQRALENAFWQGLGAVKMASKYQAEQKKETATTARSGGTIDEILTRLKKVATLHKNGEHDQARNLVHDTYANLFEGIEGELIEQDADLVADLEKDFNVTLPKALEPDTGVDEVRDIIAAMKKKLRKADKLLDRAREHKKDVF